MTLSTKKNPLPRTLLAFALLVALACTSFTLVASLVLALGFGAPPVPGAWMRAALFLVLTGITGGLLWWLLSAERRHATGETIRNTHGPIGTKEYVVAIAAAVFSLLLTLPNLGDWPRAEPDETHHLIVAKNVVEHGRYASGNPEAGFKDFDPFDSVGPVGIGLGVSGIYLFDGSIVAVRALVAICLARLIYLLFHLYRPLFGPRAAWAVWIVPMTFSTVYLGRTFYGEVPAMMLFVLALIYWRSSIAYDKLPLAFLAGMFLGFAVLVKSILVLSAFAFAAVWFYDLATRRVIRVTNILVIGMGTLFPLAAWAFLQSRMANDPADAAGSTVALYQHYLLFGVEPILGNLARSIAGYPLAHAGYFAAIAFALPRVLGKKIDPAMQVLLVYAAFNAYWWLCFTPGQLPRYLWYSYAAAAPLVGWLACLCFERMRDYRSMSRRLVALAAFAALLAPPASWAWGQAREVYGNHEMADVRALAEFVDSFPEDARIATTHYPLEGNLSFLVDRYPARGNSPEILWPENDVVITLSPDAPALPGASARSFGVYWALYRQPEIPE